MSAGTDLDLGRVTTDTAAIVDVLAATPDAAIGCYDGWTVVDLARHVGQIHQWVAGVVATGATERPTGGYGEAAADDQLGPWLREGADRLVDVLAGAEPGEAVWTISRHQRDVGFWRQRMVLETALHRWDAEVAAGRDADVDDEVAVAGLGEALDVYLAQRLDGSDVGGSGQRVAFAPAGADGWTLTLRPDGVDVTDGVTDSTARIGGAPLDLWLLVTCRRGLDGLTVVGDGDAAALAVRAATMVPGPAG